ncbi:MAG: RdgB/HAM1 family non-canonical purine NTP pyrophosphatase [Chloroflexota bacterium]|nr:RdgB/HAM1 family non-canonical purine NTP pyrophosphatase [Chloroflexota bacterium]
MDYIKYMDLLLATHNSGKVRELSDLLASPVFELISLKDIGIEIEVEETGTTLEANASLKASFYSRLSSMTAISDDSGLEVSALGGAPGVNSSRYAGNSATDTDRIEYLLNKLKNHGIGPWKAKFRCVIAIAWNQDDVELHVGECFGLIVDQRSGEAGFGYDPIFLIPELGKTMSELSVEEKNQISHRGIACSKALRSLEMRLTKQ